MIPAGGFGLHAVIEDVPHLCWKLAFVLKGLASEALPASYEAERLPVGRRTVAQPFQFVRRFERRDVGEVFATPGYTPGPSYASQAVVSDGTPACGRESSLRVCPFRIPGVGAPLPTSPGLTTQEPPGVKSGGKRGSKARKAPALRGRRGLSR